MKDMLKRLDNILLSDDVVKEFYINYIDPDFKNWLLGILPEVEACKNQKQDNPWHIYNCLDHILHSVQAINSLDKNSDYITRRELAYTMFFHDIGKPKCYIRRYSKLYKREVDSFFNHNLESERIADRALKSFDFDQKEQALIKLLVKNHDIFMFIKQDVDGNKYHKLLDEKLVEGFIEEFNAVGDGVDILAKLLLVGRADSSAQNPEMTKPSFALIDKMQEILDDIKRQMVK